MNPIQASEKLVDAILRLGEPLGVTRQFWIDNEWPDRLLIDISFPITNLTVGCINEMQQAEQLFENSISIIFGFDALEFPKHATDSTKVLNDIQSIASDGSIEITIEINKVQFLRDHFPDIFSTGRTLLYIFPEKITQIFTDSSLIDLQELIWGYSVPANSLPASTLPGLLEQVFILVPDETMLYAGDYLVLIGGEYLTTRRPDWILTRKINPAETYSICMANRHNELLWPQNYPLVVTPWHFYLLPPQPVGTGLETALKHHFFFLFLLFTADRTDELNTSEQIGYYKSAYTGSEHQACVTASNPWPRNFFLTIPEEACAILRSILDFIHENPTTCADKLTIAQLVLMDSILGKDENLAAAEIIRKAGEIKRKLEWHWKIFIEGRITKNWQVVKEIESAINQTIKEYSDQVNDLVGKINETVLAAIGVILGSFLTAIFAEEFNAVIFRIGVVTYAAYVFFFPLLYSMINRWQTYQTTMDQFAAQQDSYVKLLSEAVIQEMIDKNKYALYLRRFRLWFFLSVGVYVLLIFLLALASVYVPSLFA